MANTDFQNLELLAFWDLGALEEYFDDQPKEPEEAFKENFDALPLFSKPETKEMIQLLLVQLSAFFTLRPSILHKRVYQVKFRVELSMFKSFFWDTLDDAEALCDDPALDDTILYPARISFLDRVCSLLGSRSLLRRFRDDTCVLLAPVAKALSSWNSSAPGIQLPASRLPFLSVSEAEDLIPLCELFTDWCVVYQACTGTTPCRLLGLEVQGRIGLVPMSRIAIVSPVEYRYNKPRMMFSLTFPVWKWDKTGILVTHV